MSYLEALILGLVQGLTEFLPVSSSGHLELTKALFPDGNVDAHENNMLFTVVLHAATALSTLIIFRKEVMEIVRGLFQFKWNESTRFSLFIVVSMIPAALVGYFLDDQLKLLFSGKPWAVMFVGGMLLLTGLLLFLADKAAKTDKKVTMGSAILIGVSQAIAILPGISRSGATISTSVLLGIDRERAARFSFLMVVPLIFGKMAKDMLGGEIVIADGVGGPLLVGFLAAFIAGLLACKWMIALVKRAKLVYFSYYCFVVGVAAIIWQATL